MIKLKFSLSLLQTFTLNQVYIVKKQISRQIFVTVLWSTQSNYFQPALSLQPKNHLISLAVKWWSNIRMKGFFSAKCDTVHCGMKEIVLLSFLWLWTYWSLLFPLKNSFCFIPFCSSRSFFFSLLKNECQWQISEKNWEGVIHVWRDNLRFNPNEAFSSVQLPENEAIE